MVQAHEGGASTEIARHWLRRQPLAFSVFRSRGGELIGFMANLALEKATPDDRHIDPAIPAALAFADRHGPLRPGEEAVHLRFWKGRDTYQSVSPVVNLTAINSVNHWLTHPKLAWNFITTADPEFWLPHFSSINMYRSPEAAFQVGERRYGVFAHDWRVEPAAVWAISSRTATSNPNIASPSAGSAVQRLALSQPEFHAAVRQALRDFTRPDRLAGNPLACALGVPSPEAAPATLQALLREAVTVLANTPKDRKLHRALWHTYIEPAPTQAAAAELLDLPFNTYRHHLAKGIEHVTSWLWRRYLEAVR